MVQGKITYFNRLNSKANDLNSGNSSRRPKQMMNNIV